MPTALRRCPFPGCTTSTRGGRCPEHAGMAEELRGSRQDRGYDAAHDRLRDSIARRIDAGELVICWRCRHPIRRGQDWDLGHEGGVHRGPEHAAQCNRSAAGRLGATVTNERG